MNFEKLCNLEKTMPLDPKSVLVEFLKHDSQVFRDILENREDLYIELLNVVLEKNEKDLEKFVDWYRDYLYNY